MSTIQAIFIEGTVVISYVYGTLKLNNWKLNKQIILNEDFFLSDLEYVSRKLSVYDEFRLCE